MNCDECGIPLSEVEVPEVYLGVLFWSCPRCNATKHRDWPGQPATAHLAYLAAQEYRDFHELLKRLRLRDGDDDA